MTRAMTLEEITNATARALELKDSELPVPPASLQGKTFLQWAVEEILPHYRQGNPHKARLLLVYLIMVNPQSRTVVAHDNPVSLLDPRLSFAELLTRLRERIGP